MSHKALNTAVSVGIAVRCEPQRGATQPLCFILLDFRLNGNSPKSIERHPSFDFSTLSSNRPIWAFPFYQGIFSTYRFNRHTSGLWATHIEDYNRKRNADCHLSFNGDIINIKGRYNIFFLL